MSLYSIEFFMFFLAAGNEDAIEVYTPERPYTIYTQTRAEKTLWLTKLRETIYHHLRDQKKCEPDRDCNTGTLIHPQQLDGH